MALEPETRTVPSPEGGFIQAHVTFAADAQDRIAAVVVKIVLKSHVSEPVRQGAGMYVMWLCLYPAMKAWSHKPERASSSKKRQLNFIGWTIIGLLPAIFVTVAYIYFP